MKGIILTALVMQLLASPAWGSVDQGFEQGLAAYQRGDYATALREWLPLASRGAVDAQYNLGSMYANGRGVHKDYSEAARWYRKAAELGYPPAQHKLGLLYRKGLGVPQDTPHRSSAMPRGVSASTVGAPDPRPSGQTKLRLCQ